MLNSNKNIKKNSTKDAQRLELKEKIKEILSLSPENQQITIDTLSPEKRNIYYRYTSELLLENQLNELENFSKQNLSNEETLEPLKNLLNNILRLMKLLTNLQTSQENAEQKRIIAENESIKLKKLETQIQDLGTKILELENKALNNELKIILEVIQNDEERSQSSDLSYALISALKDNKPYLANKLLMAKANVNAKDEEGDCALKISIDKGHLGVMQKLINGGANLNLMDKDKNTPLGIAALRHDTFAVEALLQAKANVNAKNIKGLTPLMQACKNPYARTVIEILLRYKADINVQDLSGQSALIYARTANDQEAMQTLTMQKDFLRKHQYSRHQAPCESLEALHSSGLFKSSHHLQEEFICGNNMENINNKNSMPRK